MVNLEELAKLRWIGKLPYGSIAKRMRIAASTLYGKAQELKIGGGKHLKLDPADLKLIETGIQQEGEK